VPSQSLSMSTLASYSSPLPVELCTCSRSHTFAHSIYVLTGWIDERPSASPRRTAQKDGGRQRFSIPTTELHGISLTASQKREIGYTHRQRGCGRVPMVDSDPCGRVCMERGSQSLGKNILHYYPPWSSLEPRQASRLEAAC